MYSESSSRSSSKSKEKTRHNLRRKSVSKERTRIRMMELVSVDNSLLTPLRLSVKEYNLKIYWRELSKKLKAKEDKINLYHDGVFIERPFDYTNGDLKVIDDVDFEEMLYVHMFDIIRRVVLISPTSLFFKLVDEPLVGLKPLKTDEDVENTKKQAVKTPFKADANDDAPSTYENLEDLKDIVDFEVEGEENVVIPENTTDDPWHNKLVRKGNFIGHIEDPITNLGGRFIHEENDLEDSIVDPKSYSTTMPFTVYLYHDGVFVKRPLEYTNGDFKLVDEPLAGLKLLKTDEDTGFFVKALYENGSIIDLYCEHNGYDVMEMIQNEKTPKEQAVKTPFKADANDDAPSTYENLEDLKDIVDFEVEGEENVVIPENTTDDPWHNKLVRKGNFIGHIDDPTANLGGRFIHEENDPEDSIVDPKCKFKKNILYPLFDHTTPWDQCTPVLGMKFENPLQLKNMLANYKVANGYQLWFMHNDYSKLLVNCGKDVDEGNCAAFKGNKPKDKNHDVDCSTNSDKADCSSKPDHTECSSKPETKKNDMTSSTCQLEIEDRDDDKNYFRRMYICFKGIEHGWLDACRRVIGLDGYDLELGYGGGVTILSDGHKGLIEVVSGILPDSEHRQCTRRIYANFKRKWSGLQYKRLFCCATSCITKQQFLKKMKQIKELDPPAHKCLVERHPNSWCRAFFEMDKCSVAFKNGISESFNSWIILARGKPIITMLEDIRIYIMQRMCHMNKVSFKLEDTITPSIRRKLEDLKEKNWLVYPSGYKEVEVRRGDVAYGVNLHTKKPVPGFKLWKPCENPSPLPPIERKRPGRTRKQRIRHPTEDDNHVSKVGRVMHCHICWEVGHNKKGCQNKPRPKPLGMSTS
ncbi:hypothetical protein Tco_0524162 [Tanacetum coccineum]